MSDKATDGIDQEGLSTKFPILNSLEKEESKGTLAKNIMHFARVLRAAGLPVGPGKVLDALRAVLTVGIGNRDDFYWSLHAVFVNRRDQKEIFDQAFHIFWRNPQILEKMSSLVLPTMIDQDQTAETEEINRRLAEALKPPDRDNEEKEAEDQSEPDITIDAVMTWSSRELLQDMDFEKMSNEELSQAKRAIARMKLPIIEIPTRRYRKNPLGRKIDMRSTLRSSLRSGGATIPLQYVKRLNRPPPLVVLCDISGSMSRYSRMILHFLHAVSNDRDRVHTFLFGTRLTNITRYLRYKDVDDALDKVSEAVDDWSGGTRIGHSLRTYNLNWSRRTLSQGAVVLLITDGLDRDAAEGLESEIIRLHKSCRHLIWLNPLLRYDRYEPKSLGARIILPNVDDFRSVHNLESLNQLSHALSNQSSDDLKIQSMLEKVQ